MAYPIEMIDTLHGECVFLVQKYKDISVGEIAAQENINQTAKGMLRGIISALITKENLPNLFSILNDDPSALKTVRLDRYGQLKESMSLPTFRYCEIVEETWERSQLRAFFFERLFVFVVFKARGKELYLDKMLIWEMPRQQLEEDVCTVWQKTHELVRQGAIVKYIDGQGRFHTFFPSVAENACVHVRPHAQSKEDTFPLPVPDKLTGLNAYPKHSFWLNRAYILKIISQE